MPVGPPRPRRAGGALWANRPFRRLWAGQTVSLLGSQVTTIALPLTAAVTLHASPVQMGVLAGCARLPYLLLGLVAGVWVDRGSRRSIMLVCNVGQAVTLVLVPLAAAAHLLALPVLDLIAFAAGALAVFADIAGLSLLPMLVPPRDRTTSQGALEVSQSLAQIAGPALAGGLVQALSAPAAILADAVSFLFSAAALAGIRVRPGRPGTPTDGITLRDQMIVGARAVFGEPVLRAVTLCTAGFIFCTNAAGAVFVLYLTQDLGLSPSALGLSLAGGALGGLAGSVVAARLTARFGIGRIWRCR